MPTDLLYTAIGMKDYLPLNSSDRAGVLSLNVQPPKSALRCLALITCVLHGSETRSEITSFFCRWRIANQLHKAITVGQH